MLGESGKKRFSFRVGDGELGDRAAVVWKCFRND